MNQAGINHKPSYFRRQYFVNKHYQGRFIFYLCLLVFIVGVVTALFVYQKTNMVLSETSYRIHLSSSEIWKLINEPIVFTNMAIGGVSFIVASFVILLILQKSVNLLKTIEQEINSIDTSENLLPFKKADPLFSEVSKKTSRALENRLKHFLEAADVLDQVAAYKLSNTANSFSSVDILEEINEAIEEIEKGVRGFHYS